MDLDHTALLLVDIQKGFDDTEYWGTSRSNPQFEANATSILQAFRSTRDTTKSSPGPSIIHVYHISDNPKSPFAPGSPGQAFQPYATPQPENGELVISKTVNSAFIGTNLESVLKERKVSRLYVIGLTTDHCVSTTVRMAGNLKVTTDSVDETTGERKVGDGVFLIGDATAAWAKGGFDAETVHGVHVESLKEFATVVATKEVLDGVEDAARR